MLKVKQSIMVAIPPLLTVLTLVFAYIRHRNASEATLPSGNDSGSAIEETYFPPEEQPGETAGKSQESPAVAVPAEAIPAETQKDPLETGEEKLTLAEAENRLSELASPLSDLPLWQKCLGQSRPLQRFVAALDALALGKRPVEALDFLRPDQPFSGEKQGTLLRQSSASLERFTPCVQLFCSISPAAAAKLYLLLEPALQEACANLGYRDKPVRSLLTEACSNLLSTPILTEEPGLLAGGKAGLYYWQHPELEALNDAQKLFLRTGHQNTGRVRKQLEAIAAELQLYQ